MFYALLVFASLRSSQDRSELRANRRRSIRYSDPLNSSDIFKMGATIAGTLLSAATTQTSLLTSFASCMALIFAAALNLGVLCRHHRAFCHGHGRVLPAGRRWIHLFGFGGSRWTTPYAEKYVSQVVSIAARIMVLYLISAWVNSSRLSGLQQLK